MPEQPDCLWGIRIPREDLLEWSAQDLDEVFDSLKDRAKAFLAEWQAIHDHNTRH